jgi:hypothetical protein
VCSFAQDFLQEQDFPKTMFFCEFSGAPVVIRTTLEQPHFTFLSLFRAGFPESIFCGFLGAPAVIRATPEQIPLWEIMLLEEILG